MPFDKPPIKNANLLPESMSLDAKDAPNNNRYEFGMSLGLMV